MNYIGSKFKLKHFLLESISQEIKAWGVDLQTCVFTDLFSGTATVGKIFKNRVKKIISNDKEFYSFVLAKNYIQNSKELQRADFLIQILNEKTPPCKGKIYQHYALGGGENRQYFSDFNAMKIDGIRKRLSLWKDENFIDEKEYFFLLPSLLKSADKVANTASVYGAFLKNLKKSAQKTLVLRPAIFEPSANENEVYNEDANTLIKKIQSDILYLDPPYNSREYGANYHILNTIALYDDFIPSGKTGLRSYEKSPWCKKRLVYGELKNLIKNAKAKFIFLSYNDEGLLSLNDIKELFEKYGEYKLQQKEHQRFKADSKRIQKQNKTIEYLHILKKY